MAREVEILDMVSGWRVLPNGYPIGQARWFARERGWTEELVREAVELLDVGGAWGCCAECGETFSEGVCQRCHDRESERADEAEAELEEWVSKKEYGAF